MMGWFSTPKQPSKVACDIADVFTNGRIVYHNLAPLGVSTLGVRFNKSMVHVSWYSSGNPRDVTIDGKHFPGADTTDTAHIMRAAQSRARILADEEIQKISAL